MKKRLPTKSSEALIYAGAEGRTRTGTPSLTADFEFLHGVFRHFSANLNTVRKPADFIDLRPVFYGVFRPISPHAILELCVQNMFKHLPCEFPVNSRRRRTKSFPHFSRVLAKWTHYDMLSNRFQQQYYLLFLLQVKSSFFMTL